MPSFVVLIARTGKKLHILLKGLNIITTMESLFSVDKCGMIKINIYSASHHALCVVFANFSEFSIGSNNYFPNRTTESVHLVPTKYYI